MVATSLLSSSSVTGQWALRLDVGLSPGRDLIDTADLDNYALPLAVLLRNEELVSVWCTKRHADTSLVRVAPARESAAPSRGFAVRTTASSQTRAYKEQVRAAVDGAVEIAGGAVWLQVSFVVSPRRNWLNLWKPTIDALDPLLGRTRLEQDWHPKDGRITELGLHLSTDLALGHHVALYIAAGEAGGRRICGLPRIEARSRVQEKQRDVEAHETVVRAIHQRTLRPINIGRRGRVSPTGAGTPGSRLRRRRSSRRP